MSKTTERIERVIKEKGLSIRAFEQSIGASNGSVATAIKKGTDISTHTLAKIIDTYPEISADWLLCGEGFMFKKSTYAEGLADRLSSIIIDLQHDKLDNIANRFGLSAIELGNFTNNQVYPEKPFDFSRFIREFPEYNYRWILSGRGERFNGNQDEALKTVKDRLYRQCHPEYYPQDSGVIATRVDPQEMISGKPSGIPLIPYAAFAGYGSESFQDLAVEDYYIVREFKDADFLLRIKGDSMSPKFAGGDVIACKLVDGLTFWQWHKIYAICTRTQGILIKRVEEYPENPAFITCCSDNPQYKPFQIHCEDEICAIALVLGAIVIE